MTTGSDLPHGLRASADAGRRRSRCRCSGPLLSPRAGGRAGGTPPCRTRRRQAISQPHGFLNLPPQEPGTLMRWQPACPEILHTIIEGSSRRSSLLGTGPFRQPLSRLSHLRELRPDVDMKVGKAGSAGHLLDGVDVWHIP